MKKAVLALLVLSCGSPTQPIDDGGMPAQVFIALERDFTGWDTWQSFDLGIQPADSVHLGGHRTIYLNKAPPHGSTAFPVGTMMVKTVQPSVDGGTTPDGGTTQIFAMAKRGGDFNSQGATGWEWFELASVDQPAIFVWRGSQPPAGGGYGNLGSGACNTCHVSASDNDCVEAPQLKLSNF